MKKKIFLLAIMSLISVVSCGTSNDKDSDGDDPTIPPDPVVPYTLPTFSDSDFLGLLGNYYGKVGNLELTSSELTLTLNDTGSLNLYPTSISKENDSYYVYFTSNKKEELNDYRISLIDLSDETYTKYKLNLEKLESDKTYSTYSTFMPSLGKYKGAFSGMEEDDLNIYTALYNFNDIYDKDADFFFASLELPYYGYLYDYTYYYETYLTFIDNEFKVVMDLLDKEGYSYYNLLLPKIENDKIVYYGDFLNESEKYIAFYQSSAYLNGEFYLDKDNSFKGEVNETDKTFTYLDKIYEIKNIVDEKEGAITELSLDTEKLYIKPSTFGIFVGSSISNLDTYYAFYSLDSLYGTYKNNDVSYSFLLEYDYDTWESFDTLQINDTKILDYEVVVKDYKMALKVALDTTTYYFYGDYTGRTLVGVYNDTTNFLFNYSEYESSLTGTFYSFNEGSKSNVIVTYENDEFNVSYKDKTYNNVSFSYNRSMLYPKLNLGDNLYFSIFYIYEGMYVLENNNETTYFISEEFLNDLTNTYTKKCDKDLIINDDGTLVYEETTYKYSYDTYYTGAAWRNMFVFTDNLDHTHYIVVGEDNNPSLIEYDSDLETELYSYIPYDAFLNLIGTYYYEGKYGDEKFKLTKDGHFYADTLNSTNDGLNYDVEMEFYYTYSQGRGVINFYYNGYTIFVYGSSNGISVTVMGIPYVKEDLYKVRGSYFNQSGHAIYINLDNLYFDGTSLSISNVETSGNLTTIYTESGETFTYDSSTKSFTYESSTEKVSLTSVSSFNFDDYLGEITLSDGSTATLKEKYSSLSTEDSKSKIGYEVKIGTYYSFDLIPVIKDEMISLKATGYGINYYFYLDNGLKVIEESSIPLPPGL